MFTCEATAFVQPKSDTPYWMLWLDLCAEPIVISLRAVDRNRYYPVQLIDGKAHNYACIGRREGVTERSWTGPRWNG